MKILFLTWFFVISVPLSMMMGGHQLALNPSKDKNLLTLAKKDERPWRIHHFVNPECGCSENVVKNLLKRKAKQKEAHESVYVLGTHPTWGSLLKASGYEVVTGNMDDYSKKYAINAVPQLVIIHQEKILYSGGYSSKRGPASVVEDQEIFNEIVAKNAAKERPIYGCVNGSENQKKVDLIGAKYKGDQ